MKNWKSQTSCCSDVLLYLSIVLISLMLFLTSCDAVPHHEAIKARTDPILYRASDQEVVAYHLHDQRILWRFHAPQSALQTSLLVDHQTVYFLANSLYALHASSGKMLWNLPLEVASHDLILGKDMVYVITGNRLLAINRQNGSLRWMQQMPSSFAELRLHDRFLYSIARSRVLCINSMDGSIIWSDNVTPGENIQDLVFINNLLLIRTPLRLQADEATTGRHLWSRQTQILLLALSQHTIVTVFVDPRTASAGQALAGGLQALTSEDGKILWQVAAPITTRGYRLSTPETLYWISGPTNGDVTAWNIHNGSIRWQRSSFATYTTVLSTSNWLIAVTSQGEIETRRTTDGNVQWQLNSDRWIDLHLFEQTLYVVNDQGLIAAFSLDQGNPLWQLKDHLPIQVIAMQG